MRTRKYKTLKGLASQAEQLNFNELKSGRFINKSGRYVKFVLPTEEMDKAYKLLTGVLFRNVESRWHLLKYYGGKAHGIFNRLVIEKDCTASYNVGQEQECEIRVIRRILAKDRL